ncbi:patatin-like phospholipase family protein [Methylocystis sp. JR02]|uniref:patatin-like phospholipase family protein n=1 Tax=Methylocystis sp. JR02 TaxID=3046284 RepID=UPI0024B927D7|nr:patatin-like phospholipase family protein [Methylocystis sp. JR02]MDJ0448817.1 patatin-like phospholipase family protein [Methylocystis sp. JR02]
MKHEGGRIGLALSGGGFRATLFHLGAVRFLFEAELLKDIKLVSAVSGGSILAAHLILNWERYIGSKENFDDAASEVLNFVQADIRGRVLRRWMLGCSTVIPRFLLPKKWKWSLVNLLQRQYARLFRVPVARSEVASEPTAIQGSGGAREATMGPTRAATYREATIRDLRGGRPAVRFNCTSLTTGDPCYFDQAGFGRYKDGVIEAPMPALSLRVAYAVAASSAFPPLFPPVEISYETLSCDQRNFEHDHCLTDGGVYDNLGIEALVASYKEGTSAPDQRIPLDTIIISDAEGNFDSDFDAKYLFPVNRNVRANDLLMKRVSILQLQDFDRVFGRAAEEEEASFVRVKIREPVRDLDDRTVLEPEAQRALINVRTDLDLFTPNEVTALIAHGYSKAREALLDKNLVGSDAPKFAWDPLGNWEVVKALPAIELQRSRLRKWRLWSGGDPISWITGFYALFICLLLATPTLLFALQSSVDAKRAAEAVDAAAAAEAAKAVAQAQAATAKVARDAAQAQVLSGTISRIQNLMVSLSQGCSGGPHGVPPVNWTDLQPHGNAAVNALTAAKVALAQGQTENVLQQIDSAERELVALVNGVHNNCSGGAHGEDPPGFNRYTSERDRLKETLDVLKLSLGR